jgi:hypothetical protein
VLGWVLELPADRGLIQGKRLGIDTTTLEANAVVGLYRFLSTRGHL